MNMSNINKKHWRGVLGVWALAALTGALVLTTAGVASADYGQGAAYQIELVAQGLVAGAPGFGSRSTQTIQTTRHMAPRGITQARTAPAD
jgi:hypothetical protein